MDSHDTVCGENVAPGDAELYHEGFPVRERPQLRDEYCQACLPPGTSPSACICWISCVFSSRKTIPLEKGDLGNRRLGIVGDLQAWTLSSSYVCISLQPVHQVHYTSPSSISSNGPQRIPHRASKGPRIPTPRISLRRRIPQARLLRHPPSQGLTSILYALEAI